MDFWANPIAQAQIRDYKARTMHAPEIQKRVEIPSHPVLNNAANSRVEGYVQNLQFQILILYKLSILSIQHVLEENTKRSLIDLVGMCAALLRFAERLTYIRMQMKEGAQGDKQFDPRNNRVKSHEIQPLHSLRLIYGQVSQDLINPQAGQYFASAMGLEQQIHQLVTFTPTQIVQQFYSGQPIPRPQIQQPFQGPFLDDQTFKLQHIIIQIIRASLKAYLSQYSPETALTVRITQDLQQLWKKESTKRTDQSLFTPVGPTELTINMNQQQENAHRDFQAQKSYTLRYLGLKANGEHHRGLGEGHLNVSVFIQKHIRYEHLTINDWQAFWREVDTDLFLDKVWMDLDKDVNHHRNYDHDHDHEHNHRHGKEPYDRNDQFDLGRRRKRRIVILSESSGNWQNNDDWVKGLHHEVERQQLRQFRAFCYK
ncbi:MAG: hypothetical protein EZS28_008436 [Streblomastix strix]|uniref:Uncharacterized protein n=1 Tax=Streblomastix strix TaxID=222440 RepID=A0A5J4WM24_9EUKA|nr:MAG: hypothetical protein EZS28_008436 [Streblomastix strix]